MGEDEGAAAGLIAGAEGAAEGGGDAEGIEEGRGGGHGHYGARGSVAGEDATGVDGPGGGGEALERPGVAAELIVIGVGGEEFGESLFARAGDPYGGEAAGIFVGQRA